MCKLRHQWFKSNMKFAISILAILIIKSLLATPSKEKKIVVLKIFVFSFFGGGGGENLLIGFV